MAAETSDEEGLLQDLSAGGCDMFQDEGRDGESSMDEDTSPSTSLRLASSAGPDSDDNGSVSVGALSMPSNHSDDGRMSDCLLEPSQDAFVPSDNWIPGQSAGCWVGPWAPLLEQSQVLVANVFFVLKRLPQQLLSEVFEHVRPTAAHPSFSKVLRTASHLLCLAPTTVHNALSEMRANQWVPTHPKKAKLQQDASTQTGVWASDERSALENCVRVALSSAAEGRSGLSFERDLARVAIVGGTVGERNHSRHFLREIVHCGATLLSHLDAADIDMPLGALGIPSDMAILLDLVTIGASHFSRTGTVLMEAVTLVSPHISLAQSDDWRGVTGCRGPHRGFCVRLGAEDLAGPPCEVGNAILEGACRGHRRRRAIGGRRPSSKAPFLASCRENVGQAPPGRSICSWR